MASPEAITPQNLRIVDASLNRTAEGLRYLEDVSRFILNDALLTRRLKSLRRELITSEFPFQKQLMESRDAAGDVGITGRKPEKTEVRDLPTSIIANARRGQEALRTLEEFSKVVTFSPSLTSQKLEQARFELYTIEKEMLGRLLRKDKTESIRGVYVIIDMQSLKGRDHVEVTRQVIQGGARVIQLRDKTLDRGQLLPIAMEMQQVCAENNALFIVNDYTDLVLAVRADGVHLGQTDLPVSIVRKLIPLDILIGCSVYNAEQAVKAAEDGADYVAVGAIYQTPSKESVVVGLDVLRKVKTAVSLPVVAIGGINLENIAEVREAGADAVSVISAVLGAKSPETATRKLMKKFGK
ncbi:MAG: thiamine phosphate synthase [Dehalococcoidia bacterium]|nr:thiamine phosphate synthase [Dehalococcoidia bacterium]